MTYEEALEVLETIHEFYPDKFQVTKRKANLLIPQLEEMDFAGVMNKLAAFTAAAPFPPTLSQIAVFPPEENYYLERMKAWEKEADAVSEETKRAFHIKLEQLMEGFSND
ncbi:hypothetical protein MUN89_05540 [Halobacillus salinarum]|uniref:Loader and inhibitor of phage G40P n=1 Tax=Halobacillus salinarum TaxID=2932257 RepID=A0ABY4EMK8_9BACI|nr:hypothetical protein [Halobacillus salinarum]UOQ45409.1 hypothetical protein MUN89_05540 [Halobacillus salinarum]